MIVLQAAWLVVAGVQPVWAWFRSRCSGPRPRTFFGGEPDLVGYSIWAIFLRWDFLRLWALVSWALSIAPLLVLLERRSAFRLRCESFRLGKAFTSKLAEINLVMGIVKSGADRAGDGFSAAPLPFSDELGDGALH